MSDCCVVLNRKEDMKAQITRRKEEIPTERHEYLAGDWDKSKDLGVMNNNNQFTRGVRPIWPRFIPENKKSRTLPHACA